MNNQSNSHVRKGRDAARHSWLGEGRFALGVIVGVMFALGLWLALDIFSVDLSRQEFLGVIPAVAALLVATVSLVFSYNALSEHRRMRQAGTDPVILTHLGQRSDAPMLITFEVSNVGAGAAMNVAIEMDPKVADFDPERVVTNLSSLTHPIRVIRQNQSVQFNFGLGYLLLGDDPLPPFDVTVRYEDIDGVEYSSSQTIDVRELGHQAAHTPPIAEISKSLKKLSDNFQKTLSENKPINVRTQTKAEYSHEMEKRYAAPLTKEKEK